MCSGVLYGFLLTPLLPNHYRHPLAAGQGGPVSRPEAFVGSFIGVHQKLPDGHRARAPLQHAAALRERHHLGGSV